MILWLYSLLAIPLHAKSSEDMEGPGRHALTLVCCIGYSRSLWQFYVFPSDRPHSSAECLGHRIQSTKKTKVGKYVLWVTWVWRGGEGGEGHRDVQPAPNPKIFTIITKLSDFQWRGPEIMSGIWKLIVYQFWARKVLKFLKICKVNKALEGLE